MTDTPERIWIASHLGEYGRYYPEAVEAEGEHGGTAAEYVRVVPLEDDAGDDARIAAASRREWAERAWGAEAELKEARMQSLSNAGQAQEAYERQLELEAERDRLRKALETISDASPLMMAVVCRDIARAALNGDT